MTTTTKVEKTYLGEETQIIKDNFTNSKMNQFIILSYMLNNPKERVCTDDFINILSDKTYCIMSSFKRLKEKGLIVELGIFGKEKMFHIPANKYNEVKKYFIERLIIHMSNQKNKKQLSFKIFEIINSFKKMLNYSPNEIIKGRLERNEFQLDESPNNNFLIKVKEQLMKEKNLLN